MDTLTKDQLQKSPLQTWKDLHNVISLPESEDGPLHSSWLEYLQALDSGQDHHLASRLALPVSLSDLTTSDTLPLHFSGSSESVSLNISLANRLRQQLASTGSILYSLTWKKKATPAGRQYCQRQASVLRTKEIDYSSVRTNWPTPQAHDTCVARPPRLKRDANRNPEILESYRHDLADAPYLIFSKAPKWQAWPTPTANDFKGSGDTVIRKDGKDRTFDRLDYATEQGLKVAAWPTPRARDGHTEGQGKHFPSLPILTEKMAPPGLIRITDSGQMLTGSDAEMESSGQLNPAHSRWLMGFPPEWDDCAVTAMPSSRKSQQSLSKPSLPQKKTLKPKIKAGSFEYDAWIYWSEGLKNV